MIGEAELDRQNANGRIQEEGLGAELIRQAELSELKEAMEVFYVHAVMVDIVALRTALRLREHGPQYGGTATLVDAFLKMFQAQLPETCNSSCPFGKRA